MQNTEMYHEIMQNIHKVNHLFETHIYIKCRTMALSRWQHYTQKLKKFHLADGASDAKTRKGAMCYAKTESIITVQCNYHCVYGKDAPYKPT
jgi:hypothetical protein